MNDIRVVLVRRKIVAGLRICSTPSDNNPANLGGRRSIRSALQGGSRGATGAAVAPNDHLNATAAASKDVVVLIFEATGVDRSHSRG